MSFCYLASPYSKCPDLAAAHAIVCRAAGEFVKAKIPVYSPIAHSHPVAEHSGIDPLALGLWLTAHAPMIDAASCMAILMTAGHDESRGIAWEREQFMWAQKPVFMVSEIPAANELELIAGYLHGVGRKSAGRTGVE